MRFSGNSHGAVLPKEVAAGSPLYQFRIAGFSAEYIKIRQIRQFWRVARFELSIAGYI